MKFNHISPTLRYSIHKSWNRRTLVLKMSLKGISRCRSFSNIKTPYPWHDLSSLAVTPPTSISSTPFFPPSSPVLLCLCHLCFFSLSLSLSLSHTHTIFLSPSFFLHPLHRQHPNQRSHPLLTTSAALPRQSTFLPTLHSTPLDLFVDTYCACED